MFNLDEYTTVKERIKMFWDKYPDGAITTDILDWGDKRFIIKASLYRLWTDERPFATGHANEIVSERGVNRDFALENGETSAIGIACKNAGIGTEKHGPSRDEMAKVARLKIEESKAEPYVPVPNAEDPWTIKETAPAKPAADAVELVKEALGGQVIHKEIPHCEHGEMVWQTGVSKKNNKPYGMFKCRQHYSNCDAIWYNIAADGTWKRRDG